MSRLDRTSFVSGLLLVIVGTLFLLDRTGTLDLRFTALGPILTGLAGAVLLTAGLDDRRGG
jgi:hypothetical protein